MEEDYRLGSIKKKKGVTHIRLIVTDENVWKPFLKNHDKIILLGQMGTKWVSLGHILTSGDRWLVLTVNLTQSKTTWEESLRGTVQMGWLVWMVLIATCYGKPQSTVDGTILKAEDAELTVVWTGGEHKQAHTHIALSVPDCECMTSCFTLLVLKQWTWPGTMS